MTPAKEYNAAKDALARLEAKIAEEERQLVISPLKRKARLEELKAKLPQAKVKVAKAQALVGRV